MPASATVGRQLVSPGIDRLLTRDRSLIAGRRVGLVSNPASIDASFAHTADRLLADPDVTLVALFGPQHGFRSDLQDNMIETPHARDCRRRVPVFSLYSGRTRSATPEQLRQIDVLVIDLQDIGTRSYTFVGSMRLAVEACFENGKEVVVLDRPNPLGGLKVSGPPLDAQWINFLAPIQMPYVHGLTMGEIARMAVHEPDMLQIPDDVRRRGKLTVIAMRGWKRSMRWIDTGLAWVPTSPNVGTFEAVAGTDGNELAGFLSEKFGDGAGVAPPYGYPRQNQGAGVNLVAPDFSFLVLPVDKRLKGFHIDSRVVHIGR